MANKTFKKLTKVVGGVSYDTAVEVANRDIEGNVISSTYAKKNDLNSVVIDLGIELPNEEIGQGTIDATTLQKINDALNSNKSITFKISTSENVAYLISSQYFYALNEGVYIVFSQAEGVVIGCFSMVLRIATGQYIIIRKLFSFTDYPNVNLGTLTSNGTLSTNIAQILASSNNNYNYGYFSSNNIKGFRISTSVDKEQSTNTLYIRSIFVHTDEKVYQDLLTINLSNYTYTLETKEVESGSSSPLFDLGTLTDTPGQLSEELSNNIRSAINDGSIKNAVFTFKYGDFQYVFSTFSIQTLGDFSLFVFARTINQSKGIGDSFSYIRPYCFSMLLTLDKTNAGMYAITDTQDTIIPAYIDLGNFTSLPVSSSQNNLYDVLMDDSIMPIITYTLNNVVHYVYNKVYDTTNGYTFYEPLEDNKLRVIVIHSSSNFQIFEEESEQIYISDIGTITNINTNTPAFTLSSDEKTAIDTAYNNNKIVYVKFNYTNENNNTETVILPIESKIALTGGAYAYYGGGTLQNHEVWSFNISATSVFVNNITNTHRTKLFDLGTLSQLTGTLSNATEIANAFNSGYTPIIKFTYNNTTYYFTEPSGKYNASSNTGSLNWIGILSDKTIEKFILNFPAGNYTLSNEELGGGSGSATKMINLGTLTDEGRLDADKLQELMTLFQNGDLIQVTFTYNDFSYITSSAISLQGGIGIIAYGLTELGYVNCVLLVISSEASYGLINMTLPSSFKTINNNSLIGNGNIKVQEPLLSGANIKTINNQSILGSGNINLQERLYSGTNIKTVNGQSLIGSGDLEITADITYATENEVNALFTNPGQPIPNKTISLENLNAFKQQINNVIDNEIGQVLEEGF